MVIAACTAIGLGLHAGSGIPANGRGTACTLDVPETRITNGYAQVDVRADCSAHLDASAIRVAIVGDDAIYDDAVRWTSRTVPTSSADVRVRVTWPCDEDRFGKDEVYVRARVVLRNRVSPDTDRWSIGPTVAGQC